MRKIEIAAATQRSRDLLRGCIALLACVFAKPGPFTTTPAEEVLRHGEGVAETVSFAAVGAVDIEVAKSGTA